MTKIKVTEHNPIVSKKEVWVSLEGIKFIVSNMSESKIDFWLPPDEADGLAFQIGSLLQDFDMRKQFDPNDPDKERV